jgi:hypothetical protein
MWNALAAILLGVVLAGCSHSSKIATSIDFGTRPPDLTVITVKVKNQEARTTNPLAIDVSLQLKRGNEWGKPTPVLHPAAFVLNKQEEQTLRTTVKLRGETIRGKITVKEQLSGKLVSTEEFEKVLSGRSSTLPYLTGVVWPRPRN